MKTQNTIKKWSTMALSLWILFVSTGFTLHQHYCGGEQKSFRLFITAPNCHEQGTSCHQKIKAESFVSDIDQKCNSDKNSKPCCENEATFLKLDSDLVENSILQINYSPLEFKNTSIARPLANHSFKAFQTVVLQKDYKNIRPPLLRKNLEIPVFVQSFLC